jgi:lipopolysaccharide transport system permease protein
MFHVDIKEYAPYILSGIISWDFIVATLTGGSLAFVQSEPYIKQQKLPLAIYTLRIIIGNTVVLLMASLVLCAWVLIAIPHSFSFCWVASLLFFPAIACITWPLATLLAYLTTKYRDIPHALGLLLQALWFVSPVYFSIDMFRRGGLDLLVDYNPIYHLLEILRAPLLEGSWPTACNITAVVATSAFGCLLAYGVGRKMETNVIFYL